MIVVLGASASSKHMLHAVVLYLSSSFDFHVYIVDITGQKELRCCFLIKMHGAKCYFIYMGWYKKE